MVVAPHMKAGGGDQFWQHDLHPIWLRRTDIIQQKRRYLYHLEVEIRPICSLFSAQASSKNSSVAKAM